MSKYSIDDFKKGDVVSITQNEDGKDVTYTGTVTKLFKAAINSGIVRIKDKRLNFGFKDIGVIWIKKVKFIKRSEVWIVDLREDEWHKKYNLLPTCYKVENIETIEVE